MDIKIIIKKRNIFKTLEKVLFALAMKKILLLLTLGILSCSLSAQFLINEEPIVLNLKTINIYGTLRVPVAKSKIPLAIIIAGSGPTDRNGNQPSLQNNSLKLLSEALYANGIATLCFDKRGIGESKNDSLQESDLRFEDYIDDVRQWVTLLSKDNRISSISIIGHSEGSLIGIIASENNNQVSKFVSIAGVAEPASMILKSQLSTQLAGQPQMVKDQIFSYIDQLEKGELIKDVPASLFSLFRPSVQPYMISWFKYDPQKEIAKLSIPILIIQGTTDLQVSVNNAVLLVNANTKAEKVVIENMNHVMKDSQSQDMQTQFAETYNNPTKPIDSILIDKIVDFIKK